MRRLERQFSLYQQDSAVCELNRTGVLVAPDADMVLLLQASLGFADLTNGAFDPTVQPLWRLKPSESIRAIVNGARNAQPVDHSVISCKGTCNMPMPYLLRSSQMQATASEGSGRPRLMSRQQFRTILKSVNSDGVTVHEVSALRPPEALGERACRALPRIITV